jgi:hypothetical protein
MPAGLSTKSTTSSVSPGEMNIILYAIIFCYRQRRAKASVLKVLLRHHDGISLLLKIMRDSKTNRTRYLFLISNKKMLLC